MTLLCINCETEMEFYIDTYGGKDIMVCPQCGTLALETKKQEDPWIWRVPSLNSQVEIANLQCCGNCNWSRGNRIDCMKPDKSPCASYDCCSEWQWDGHTKNLRLSRLDTYHITYNMKTQRFK